MPLRSPLKGISCTKTPWHYPLRHHNYRIFVALSLVGGGGVWMQRLAQDWLVLQLTGNSFSSPGRRRVQP